MTIQELRSEFPILSRKVYGKDLVYFDNAATMQRPASVVEKWVDSCYRTNANIHRAVHLLASEATDDFETTRESVQQFLNAEKREEIIFTAGATASINLVAFSFGEAFVQEGDEIIVTEAEHHSNIIPWQMMCQRKKAELVVWHVDDQGRLDLEELQKLIGPKTRLLAMTHVSNVLGLVNPIDEAARICHSRGVRILVDGAQGVVHQVIDVQQSDVDFYAFSGHKIYAAPGVGVLYGKKEILDQLPPYMGGGEMIGTVRFSGSTYAEVPYKFEAGTQNLSGVPTLKPALELALKLRDPNLSAYHEQVKKYIYEALCADARIRLLGIPEKLDDKIALFSFTVEGVHHEDLALILDKMGIAVRSGQVCAEPLMDRFGTTGILRASLAMYNTMEEAEYFIKSLNRAIDMLV